MGDSSGSTSVHHLHATRRRATLSHQEDVDCQHRRHRRRRTHAAQQNGRRVGPLVLSRHESCRQRVLASRSSAVIRARVGTGWMRARPPGFVRGIRRRTSAGYTFWMRGTMPGIATSRSPSALHVRPFSFRDPHAQGEVHRANLIRHETTYDPSLPRRQPGHWRSSRGSPHTAAEPLA